MLVKRRRTELPGSIVQLQQKIEVFDMENKVPDGLSVEDSTGKDPMDVLTRYAAQNSGQGNSCSKDHVSDISFQFDYVLNGNYTIRLCGPVSM